MDPAIFDSYVIPAIHNSELFERKKYLGEPLPPGYPDLPAYSLEEVFDQKKKILHGKVVVELCCGTGEFLIEAAQAEQGVSFIGVDYARPVLQRAAKKANEAGLQNILFYLGRVMDFLSRDFRNQRFDEILVNFPDPWPKKRHHKRRIIQEETARALGNSLKPGGLLLTATDILEIHQDHLEKLGGNPLLRLANGDDTRVVPAKWYAAISTYERKGRDAERGIHYTRHVRLE